MRSIRRRDQLLTQLALALIGLFVLIPIWALVNIALDADIKGGLPANFRLWPEHVTLATFDEVIENPAQSLNLLDLFRNSLIVSGGAALIGVVFGMTSAYAFARYRFPGKQIGLFALLLGALLPPVALLTPLYLLLTMLDLRSSLFGLMLAYSAFAIPFCLWNMRAAFQAVPLEVEESAFLDGASPTEAFIRITLPLALPSVAIAALIAFLAAYTEFAIGWMLVESSKTVTLAMAISGMVGQFGRVWNKAAALSLFMSIPIVIITLILRRLLIQGALLGSIED
jgi:arabinogalactan oligomer / maltooligosaccharide transport system permease protein